MKVRETEISKVSRDSTRAPSDSMNHDAKTSFTKQKALTDEPPYLQSQFEAKTSELLAARLHATSPFGEPPLF